MTNLLALVPTTDLTPPVVALAEQNLAVLLDDRLDVEVLLVVQTERSIPRDRFDLSSRLRVTPTSVRGQGAALAWAVTQLVGEVREFLTYDDDVVLLPGSVPALLAMSDRFSLAYCGARVVPQHPANRWSEAFEAMGGLGKGSSSRIVDPTDAQKGSFRPTHVAVGACAIVATPALRSIGGYDPRFGSGSTFKSGQSLDVVYRLLHAGFSVGYCAEAVVQHGQPTSFKSLAKRAFYYGYSDGALTLHWWRVFHDERARRQLLGAHFVRNGQRMRRLVGARRMTAALGLVIKQLAFIMGAAAMAIDMRGCQK